MNTNNDYSNYSTPGVEHITGPKGGAPHGNKIPANVLNDVQQGVALATMNTGGANVAAATEACIKEHSAASKAVFGNRDVEMIALPANEKIEHAILIQSPENESLDIEVSRSKFQEMVQKHKEGRGAFGTFDVASNCVIITEKVDGNLFIDFDKQEIAGFSEEISNHLQSNPDFKVRIGENASAELKAKVAKFNAGPKTVIFFSPLEQSHFKQLLISFKNTEVDAKKEENAKTKEMIEHTIVNMRSKNRVRNHAVVVVTDKDQLKLRMMEAHLTSISNRIKTRIEKRKDEAKVEEKKRNEEIKNKQDTRIEEGNQKIQKDQTNKNTKKVQTKTKKAQIVNSMKIDQEVQQTLQKGRKRKGLL